MSLTLGVHVVIAVALLICVKEVRTSNGYRTTSREKKAVPCNRLNTDIVDLVTLREKENENSTNKDRVLLPRSDVKEGIYPEFTVCWWTKGHGTSFYMHSQRYPHIPEDFLNEIVEVFISLEDDGGVKYTHGNETFECHLILPSQTIDLTKKWTYVCTVIDVNNNQMTAHWNGGSEAGGETATITLPSDVDAAQFLFDSNEEFVGDLFYSNNENAVFRDLNVWSTALSAKQVAKLSKSCINCGDVYCWKDYRAENIIGQIIEAFPSTCLTQQDLKQKCINPATAKVSTVTTITNRHQYGKISKPKSGYGSNPRYGSNSGSGSGSRYGSNSGSGSGSRYGSNSGSGSGSRYGSNSGSGSGSRYGSNSGSGSGSRYGSNSGSGSGSRYGSNSGSGSGSRYGSSSGYDSDSGYGSNSGTRPGSRYDSNPGSDSGYGYGAPGIRRLKKSKRRGYGKSSY